MAIDPNPRIGDPCSDIGEFAAEHPPATGILPRAAAVAARMDLDPHRAQQWAAVWTVLLTASAWRSDQSELAACLGSDAFERLLSVRTAPMPLDPVPPMQERHLHAQSSLVIAISGPSGAGKTTTVNAVAARLGNASALFYDEYFRRIPHPDIRAWIEQGADPDRWAALPDLVDAVRALRDGRAIDTPGGRTIMPARYIVLEEPWGRDRTELRPWIDFVAHLDTPLDISLCRRLLRDYASPERGDPLEFVQDYLDVRLTEVYRRMQRAGDHADLVVDALRPPEQIAEEIVAAIHRLETAR